MEAQLAEALRLEWESGAAERERGELARIALVDRLRGSEGNVVSLELQGSLRLLGRLQRVGSDWLVLEESASDWLVATRGIRTVSGLAQAAPPSEGPLWSRLGLASALRVVTRDRSSVRVFLERGGPEALVVPGIIARVGADFLELRAETLPGEPVGDQGLLAVSFAGVIALQGGAGGGVFQGV